ncbi:MAG: glycosyl transferase family 2 [Flavipsychrobacter sp.]|jgi:HAD superfamily phosphoserine phosphatase-like hydrolase|nr:glycosyl transferase family 2 [Flavipsychrobacter sp.]
MVTIIIPALNEEKTIGQVIRQAKRSQFVSEVIVVDDQSTDNTVGEARKEQAKIITSLTPGKGSSMREGMMVAKNEVIVFLDADIPNYSANIIDVLAAPLLADEADFVKSYFERQAGRVTELLVKPTLEYFFPHLLEFRQPLSGMIAGKRSFFQKVEFENDYGVDIGLLIDMHHVNARIQEVCIGSIENDMQPLHALGRMAKQVAGAIYKRVNIFSTHTNRHEHYDDTHPTPIDERIIGTTGPGKIIVFDMDNTLLRGSFIHTAADKFGFKNELQYIIANERIPFMRTKKIAKLLKGRTYGELINTVEAIPIIADAVHVIKELKLKGYVCGIISDSYYCITNHVKNMLGMDFALSNELEFKKSIATGEVKIPSQFLKDGESYCEHDHCKSNMFMNILRQFGIPSNNSVAIGDGENDFCMIRLAGTGIAINPTYSLLHEVSDHVLHTESLKPVLQIAR